MIPSSKGAIISVEGLEGVGKTTQVKLLTEALERLGLSVKTPREPGGTAFGEEIRRLLKHSNFKIIPVTELLLFEASRAQLVASMSEHLESGGILVMDRFIDSTKAYQGYGRGISIDVIDRLNEIATGGVCPDLTFVLDLPVAESRKRLGDRGEATDNFESLEDPFFERVRVGFKEICSGSDDTKVLLDAAADISILHANILQKVVELLHSKHLLPNQSSGH